MYGLLGCWEVSYYTLECLLKNIPSLDPLPACNSLFKNRTALTKWPRRPDKKPLNGADIEEVHSCRQFLFCDLILWGRHFQLVTFHFGMSSSRLHSQPVCGKNRIKALKTEPVTYIYIYTRIHTHDLSYLISGQVCWLNLTFELEKSQGKTYSICYIVPPAWQNMFLRASLDINICEFDRPVWVVDRVW